ncbi:MAG: DUF1566 domain-containing protein [Desulfobacterales bacterium]
MNRINFFQLLELSIQPPENNPQTIDAAIKRKQSDWSRLRNHPTKGLQARQYINLLPEIRRVMQDPALRVKEAQGAVADLKNKLAARLTRLDARIRLLGAKGDIQEKDIQKLIRHHRLREQTVRKRVAAWRERKPSAAEEQLEHLMNTREISDKEIPRLSRKLKIEPDALQEIFHRLRESRFEEIESYIAIQVRKGYMTQNEISEISQVYGVPEGEVLRRVRVPIQKAGAGKGEDGHQLDETVERIIEENLKVVDQPSLYAFLGQWPSSGIESLQKKAAEKETEIRRIAIKDARVTASGVLAGHCLAIFRNDAARYAYDVSRAKALLNDINNDIDLIAEDAGSVDARSFLYLVRRAVGFGTSPGEARKHILNHCRSKGWKIDLPRFRKPRELRAVYLGLAIGSAVVLVVIAILWWRQVRTDQEHAAFRLLSDQLKQEESLDARAELLSKYLKGDPLRELATRAQMDLNKLNRRILERDLTEAQASAQSAVQTGRYEEMARILERFVQKYPEAESSEAFKSQLKEIPALIDNRDFEAITAPDPGKDIDHVIESARRYLLTHPDGRHVREVNALIHRLARPYYDHITNALESCEADGKWGVCVDLANRYIQVYKDNSSAIALRNRKDEYLLGMEKERIMASLSEKVQAVGEDPVAVQKIYLDYLNANPSSPAGERVRAELFRLGGAINRVAAEKAFDRVRDRLAGVKGRFIEKTRNTLTDSRTGLTWTMVDSSITTGRCLDYSEAVKYAAEMTVGGLKNWRLPRRSELQALLNSNPGYPGELRGDWLWTSESYRRYAGGWVTAVEVVFREPSHQAGEPEKDARECGWVMAVHP